MPETYLKVRNGGQLHYGQHVWHVVRFGSKDTDVHYKPATVSEVMRAAARVKFLDDGREVTLRFNQIVTKVEVERRSVVPPAPLPSPPPSVPAQPPLPPPPEPEETPVAPPPKPYSSLPPVHLVPNKAPKTEDAVEAWLDMGKDVLETLTKDIDATTRLCAEAKMTLENLDKTHRAEIARLEDELREAKQRHQQERVVIAGRVNNTSEKLKTLQTRRDLISSVLTAK